MPLDQVRSAMISDLEIYQLAQALIREHGERASDVAIKQAKRLLGKKNIEGHATHMRIARTSKVILNRKRPANSLPH